MQRPCDQSLSGVRGRARRPIWLKQSQGRREQWLRRPGGIADHVGLREKWRAQENSEKEMMESDLGCVEQNARRAEKGRGKKSSQEVTLKIIEVRNKGGLASDDRSGEVVSLDRGY